MKKVATIIVTFNGAQWIQRCLKSLLDSTLNTEIIIVDNNSSDTTIELLQPFSGQIALMQMGENLGFGAANNIAIKKALELGFDYVFLLNQDAYVGKTCISNLLKAAKKSPTYGILSPMQLNGNGDALDVTFENQISRTIKPIPKVDFKSKVENSDLLPPKEVRFVGAAAWFIPRQALRKVGLFHPAFYHYGEDNNYAARLQYHGFKIGVVSQSAVIHDRIQRKDPKNFLPTKLRTFPLHLLLDVRKSLPVAWFTGLYQLRRIRKKFRKVSGNEYENQYLEIRKWFFQKLPEARRIRKSFRTTVEKS